QAQCRFVERLSVEFMSQIGSRIGAQTNVLAFKRLVSQQQAQVAQLWQRLADFLEATNAEVGSGNVHLLPALALKEGVQHICQPGFDVVDDIWDSDVIFRHKVSRQ